VSERQLHDFGRVDDKGDAFEFVVASATTGTCYLVAVVQTERGPRRTEVAAVPSDFWTAVAVAAAKELAAEMGESERASSRRCATRLRWFAQRPPTSDAR